MSLIRDIWNSDVRRFHASRCFALRNCGDTTDAHAARTQGLVIGLYPDASRELIVATLYHDKAERVTGDNPWGAKMASEDLRSVLEFLESRENARLGISRWFEALTPVEWEWLKLGDRIDPFLLCREVAPWQLDTLDWRNAWHDIMARADRLNVRGPVFDLIGEFGGRAHVDGLMQSHVLVVDECGGGE